MRVGVTGAGGLVGSTLLPLWRRAGVDVTGWTRRDLDVTNHDDVVAAIREARVDAVVNLAAYTNVDRAEDDRQAVMDVNWAGALNVAYGCLASGARCVQVSSDYVLDGGRQQEPLAVDAPMKPQGAYAMSKAAAEDAVRWAGTVGCRWLIARTGWVYGPGGKNFVDTMRGMARAGTPARVVDDQHGAPTSTRLLSAVLLELVRQDRGGTWHIAPAGITTWCGVARAVYAAAGQDPALVSPCTTEEASRPAPRPRWSVLDTGATAQAIGHALPPWERDVEAYVTTDSLPRSAWENAA